MGARMYSRSRTTIWTAHTHQEGGGGGGEIAFGRWGSMYFSDVCPVHREHTILLSRERANKGPKRKNSLLLSPVVISYTTLQGKLLLCKSCVTL